MTKAYVLITTEIGRGDDVYSTLGEMEEVREVSIVAGTYDIVAIVESQSARDIGRIVMDRIQRIDGVMSTVTLMAIR
jgi:DNA-binding Lrp family transcriptional regulator